MLRETLENAGRSLRRRDGESLQKMAYVVSLLHHTRDGDCRLAWRTLLRTGSVNTCTPWPRSSRTS